jgi:PAS domain S-box-containing protein
METENYRSDLLGHSGLGGSASGTGDLAQQALDVVRDLVAELKSREAHLRSILETVPDAMVIIDEVGLIQSFSTTAERLFGFTADEIRGRNVNALMPAPYQQEHDSYLKRYLATGERRIIGNIAGGGRPAQGRQHLPDGAVRRRGFAARQAAVHRLRAQSYRAA